MAIDVDVVVEDIIEYMKTALSSRWSDWIIKNDIREKLVEFLDSNVEEIENNYNDDVDRLQDDIKELRGYTYELEDTISELRNSKK